MSRSFVFILVFLTLLGHACELPIGQIVAAHAHDDTHHASDHHADDSQLACDAVLAVSRCTHAFSNLDLDLPARLDPDVDIGMLHVVSPAPRDSRPGHRRPPLFLLHAALLI